MFALIFLDWQEKYQLFLPQTKPQAKGYPTTILLTRYASNKLHLFAHIWFKI